MILVALVGALTLSGVAMAAPEIGVRLPTETTGAPPPNSHVTVEKGDHLWKMSQRQLGDQSPAIAVAPYWRRVVKLNAPHLRSRNPDLIYPGEIIEMPGLSEQP